MPYPDLIRRLERATAAVLAAVPEVAAAYAYGSRVRGDPLPASDLDLAFVLAEDREPEDPLLAEVLASRIAERLGPEVELDAHLTRHLPLPVLGRVVTEGVLLHDADPSRRVAFETSTRRLYFDFLPLLERDARTALRGGHDRRELSVVDPQKARQLLARYRTYRGYLEDLRGRPDEELRSDFAVMGGVQHYLQLAIETLLDLGSHVIASEGFEPPGSYADIFRVLRDEGVFEAPLAERLMAMARFRNVLVHLYAEVDEERVLRILRGSLGDLDRFVETLRDRFRRELAP